MKHSYLFIIALLISLSSLAQKKSTGYGHLDFSILSSKYIKQRTAIATGVGISPDGFTSFGLGIDAYVLQSKYKAMVNPHIEFSYFLKGLNKGFTPFATIEPGVSLSEGINGKQLSGSFQVGIIAKRAKSPGLFATVGYSSLQKQNWVRLSFGLCF